MVRAGSSVIRPVQVCPVMPDLVEPYTRRACSTHFTFQAASHSTFAIAGVASLSLAHGGRGECRRRPVQGATRQNDAKSDYRWILASKCPRYISGAVCT